MKKEGSLMGEKNWLELLTGQNLLQKVVELNQKTEKFGLVLTEEEAKILVEKRKENLREFQRVEFGEGILPKLIFSFCDSPYLYQDNYVETIIRLQEIFYLYKNESMDELTDDELLEYMKSAFDGVCMGSLEYLEETALDEFARNIRSEGRNFFGRYYKIHGKGLADDKFKLEELLPIVAELAERYTAKESTSISYDRARQLMGAVSHCISQCGGSNQVISNNGITAKEAYQLGYENLVHKIKQTQTAYNAMIVNFNAYGNENYNDTVTKAIPGFFRYYDVRFAPQDTIITMDYPALCPITECSGIDAIEKYVEYISYEQKFMAALPEEYVYEVLYRFQTEYKKQFYNICSIILRHMLCRMMIGKRFGNVTREKDYEMLCRMIEGHNPQWLVKSFSELLEKMIHEIYEDNRMMGEYLKADLKDFATEIFFAVKNDNIQKVVVL